MTIQIYPFSGVDNQLFTFTPVGSGWYSINSSASSQAVSLASEGGSDTDMIKRAYAGEAMQRWQPILISGS